MPASDLHDPEDRTAVGTKIKYLYCPECGHYSGGGVCRVCARGHGAYPQLPEPEHQIPADPIPDEQPQLMDSMRPIDERLYKSTTIGRFEAMTVAAKGDLRGVVPSGTTGRITAKRGGLFTIRFDNGHTLVKVPYKLVLIVEARDER